MRWVLYQIGVWLERVGGEIAERFYDPRWLEDLDQRKSQKAYITTNDRALLSSTMEQGK